MTSRSKLFVSDGQGQYAPASDDEVLSAARTLGKKKLARKAPITSPDAIQEFLQPLYAHEDREHFGVVFLTVRHSVIAHEVMFMGCLQEANVYPRQVVKRALELNASAVILVHNHPSGETDPSIADRSITRRLKDGLDLVNVRVLDHVIFAGESAYSFAENGLV